MTKKKKKKVVESWHYCHPCQIKRGGVVPKGGHIAITMCLGDCSGCGAKGVTLVPNADYDWPKKGRKAWFD